MMMVVVVVVRSQNAVTVKHCCRRLADGIHKLFGFL